MRPNPSSIPRAALGIGGLLLAYCLVACGGPAPNTRDVIVVSVSDQKLALYQDGALIRMYPISTSRYGVGNTENSNRTPLGWMEVAHKVGGDAPVGAIFRARRWTGETSALNDGEEDLVLTRILWLTGTEPDNRNTMQRYIYIHGTNQEQKIGRPASQGCVRMTSSDVIDLYDRVDPRARVLITARRLTPPDS